MRYQKSLPVKSNKNRSTRRVTAPKKPSRLRKSVGVIIGLAIVLFGLKLLLTPVVRTLAAVWDESATAISFMLPGAPKIAKDEHGNTNVLLVGIDKRSFQPYQYAGPDGSLTRNGFLADTIIVASIDSERGVVNMLSLPRDLWVRIPAFEDVAEQHAKINAVHALGDRYGYPDSGGMGLLKAVVEDVTGMPIHYWMRTDFEAFVKGVDAVEGLEVYVENAFDDYMYPRAGYENAVWEERYEHVQFAEGWQMMDGETALKYARSRHALGAEGSDFARAKRQQKVIEAFITKVMSTETLFNLQRIQGLYQAVSENVTTNIELGELPLFYGIAKDLNALELKGHVLGGPDIDPPLLYAPDPGLFAGAYVLIPTIGQNNYTKIHEWIEANFYPAPTE